MNKELMFSSKEQTWETPPEVFGPLNEEFGFTLDPCCTKETAKAAKYFTPEDDGLAQSWAGETVFVNPPYGRELKRWVAKAAEESRKPGTRIVLLIPARTDTSYFHDYIYNKADIRFLRGRIKFKIDGKQTNGAPFPSMIVVFKPAVSSYGTSYQHEIKRHE